MSKLKNFLFCCASIALIWGMLEGLISIYGFLLTVGITTCLAGVMIVINKLFEQILKSARGVYDTCGEIKKTKSSTSGKDKKW